MSMQKQSGVRGGQAGSIVARRGLHGRRGSGDSNVSSSMSSVTSASTVVLDRSGGGTYVVCCCRVCCADPGWLPPPPPHTVTLGLLGWVSMIVGWQCATTTWCK